MLEIAVHEIRGKCPVYKVGDKMLIDDPTLFLFTKNPFASQKPLRKKCFAENLC